LRVDLARRNENPINNPKAIPQIKQYSNEGTVEVFRGERLCKDVVASQNYEMDAWLTLELKECSRVTNNPLTIPALEEDLLWLDRCFAGETYAIDQIPCLQEQF
ncbi:hypothetical protein Ancab_028390, partial [Ancistrocladus abbreviatus]